MADSLTECRGGTGYKGRLMPACGKAQGWAAAEKVKLVISRKVVTRSVPRIFPHVEMRAPPSRSSGKVPQVACAVS